MSFWDTHQHKIDPDKFRAHEQYLGGSENWAEQIEFIERTGATEWLDIMGEDGSFGVHCGEIGGRVVSRDLLDSVIELSFLRNTLPRDAWLGPWLDIGAGYGRIAHRRSQLHSACVTDCTDEIPISREVCARYLEARGVLAKVIEPRGLGVGGRAYELAINVHSWPECTHAQIIAWLDRLVGLGVPYLFVIPHLDREMLCVDSGRSFRPDIEGRGWRLAEHWYGPDCWPRDYYLFHREAP
jgi:hypothetical protein